MRALRGPAPFLGSDAIAISPDAKNVYVASSRSNAIAVFQRDKRTGELSQAPGKAGCIANQPVTGCTTGRALDGADVVAVSPDGGNVYVGAFFANAVAIFDRDQTTGALTQPAGDSGCIVDPIENCAWSRSSTRLPRTDCSRTRS